ncbi:hypothetical protein ACFE04_020905 [Oxalis oulophora]
MGVEEKMEDKINTTNPSNVVEEDNAVVENGGQQSSSTASTSASASASASANSVTHPLEHSWTFWFDNPQAKSKQATWGSSMRSIFTFATVEEFWSCVKSPIIGPKRSPSATFTISNARSSPNGRTLFVLMVGNGPCNFLEKNPTPLVVSVRGKQEKIALWTKNAANEAAQLSIGRQWKEFLDYNDSIGFIFHEDARKHDRNGKNRYTI